MDTPECYHPAPMTRIVTTTYRYKRPAKKRKAVAIAGPAIVRAGQGRRSSAAA